jgi:hypothetical protein
VAWEISARRPKNAHLQPRWRSTNKLRPVTQRLDTNLRLLKQCCDFSTRRASSPLRNPKTFAHNSQRVTRRRRRRPARFPQSLRRCEKATPPCDPALPQCLSVRPFCCTKRAAASCCSVLQIGTGKGALSLAVRVQSGTSKLGRGLPGEYLPVPTLRKVHDRNSK